MSHQTTGTQEHQRHLIHTYPVKFSCTKLRTGHETRDLFETVFTGVDEAC